MKIKIRAINNIIKTYYRKFFNKSDFKRWSTLNSYSKDWDSRTIKMAKLISPNSKVIEFGAGRKVLKNHLPENCSYTPSDIVDRGIETVVCDLNQKKLPIFKDYDYAVFSGVLEYVNDVPRLIRHLSNNIDTFIISYAILKNDLVLKRGIHGWVNNFKEKELITIFNNTGYKLLDNYNWLNQKIYIFKRVKK